MASCLLGYGVENGFRVWNLRRGVIGVDKLDRGDLIFGPSGTGKTMLAEVVAQSCGVQFIAFSIGDLFQNDAHLGEVIKAPRGLFDRARLLAPCVLFIDELDSLPNRGSVGSEGRLVAPGGQRIPHGSAWHRAKQLRGHCPSHPA